MNNLCKFLHFNHTCPICDEPLSLYMQWYDSTCFKAKEINSHEYRFEQFKNKNTHFDQNDYMILSDQDDEFKTYFNSSKLGLESKEHNIFFFFLCNELGFVDKGYNDYEINLYKGCYYRSSPYMKFNKYENGHSKKWALEVNEPMCEDLVIKDESFSFKAKSADIEKVYMLNLDYSDKKTTLWHYSVSEEQKKSSSYAPKIFTKEMPLLNNRPKFELDDRDKLISRFDSWVLMS